jgi:hypothetical protein
MLKLCPNCHHIGEGLFSKSLNFLCGDIYYGTVKLALGIFLLVTTIHELLGSSNQISQIIFLIIALILSFGGLRDIRDHFLGGNICPNCEHKGMLRIYDPRALEIINKNGLTIPEEALKSSKPKASQ